MINTEQHKRIKGFEVFVFDGKEVVATTIDATRKINGPHHEAKWAMDLLGTNLTASKRKLKVLQDRVDESTKKLFATPAKKNKSKRKLSPALVAAIVMSTFNPES